MLQRIALMVIELSGLELLRIFTGIEIFPIFQRSLESHS